MTGQEPRTSAVPPPPRGKKAGQSPNTRHRNNAESDDDSVDGGAEVPTGAGYNVSLLCVFAQAQPPCCCNMHGQVKRTLLQLQLLFCDCRRVRRCWQCFEKHNKHPFLIRLFLASLTFTQF
jgi:hypothetical protein